MGKGRAGGGALININNVAIVQQVVSGQGVGGDNIQIPLKH